MHSFTNHLLGETSPYLLQHAHNPVQWYPWGTEALTRAKDEDKPILVSIGYSACHWCHVMERESFENEDTARYMNEHFINIKIDREERPDLDHIYMDAVQAMTGSGGWPLNVFLTPDRKPFYGGTYYPPVRAFNRASWVEVLQGVQQAYKERRTEIDAQAEQLTGHLSKANSFGLESGGALGDLLKGNTFFESFENIMKAADTEWGGFGNAPKFPQTFTIQFLLRFQHVLMGLESEADRERYQAAAASARAQALLSVDRMIEGGIYDQAGGGFARYSTDKEWLAPHFEKMLYDNALLLGVVSEAYQVTKQERYREVIEQTMDFIQRELCWEGQAFYAALDADSEGEEGRFYVWDMGEWRACLGNDAELMASYYDVTEKGNWEGKNILRVRKPSGEFSLENGLGEMEFKEILHRSNEKLLERRGSRVRPGLDDKILLGWNALMNTACSKTFAATGNEEYRQLAIRNMRFMLERFAGASAGEFMHTWKAGNARYPAFLDDYAYLLQALIHLQEVTADGEWLTKAAEIMEFVLAEFSEEDSGFFFYTGRGQDDVIVRKKEVYDGATPSGNAVMAESLYRLGILMDKNEWRSRAEQMLVSVGKAISRYPTSFGCWNNLMLQLAQGSLEIAIVGKNVDELLVKLLKEFIPNRSLMATTKPCASFPLLGGKPLQDQTFVYVCRAFSCLQPVFSVEAVMSLIHSETRHNNFMLIQ